MPFNKKSKRRKICSASIANFLKKKEDHQAEVLPWAPFPNSPQSQAFHSEAQELLYGGSAGGGKSQLLIGLALTGKHKKSLILRREYSQVQDLISKIMDLVPAYGGGKIVKLSDRIIEISGCKYDVDWRKFKGREHSLKGFDELSEFTENQYTSIIAWNRSADPSERCRIVATSNPPDDRDGMWMVRRWGPWLDKNHKNPAASGEVRYYITLPDGSEEEVPDSANVEIEGSVVVPRSRSFIRASVADNPLLMESGYQNTLNSLPEPLRSKLLLGDFLSGMSSNPWQVIPDEWVEAAQARWDIKYKYKIPQSVIAIDPARGGNDCTAIATKHGNYIYIEKFPGRNTPDSEHVVTLMTPLRKNGSQIRVDGIGVGASVVDALRSKRKPCLAMIASAKSQASDRTGLMRYANLRAEWYWSLRELLDPAYNPTLALPNTKEVLDDLSAPTFKLTTQGILIEEKKDIKKRLGRSPDVGDAIAMATALTLPPSIGLGRSLGSTGRK